MVAGDWRVVFSGRETLTRFRRIKRAEARALVVAPAKVLLQSVFSVLFPSDCRICKHPLLNISRLPVCDECLDAIAPVFEPQCVQCGDRLLPAQLLVGDGMCQHCRDEAPFFDRASTFGEYEGVLRETIHLLKYEGVLSTVPLLGKVLSTVIHDLLAAKPDVVPLLIAVPLHAGKRRARRFNQSELLARDCAQRLSKRVVLAKGVLERHRPTQSQVGLTREQRVANMQGAFRVRNAQAVRGQVVILVDDVMTTGATLSECARILKKAGVAEVWAVTVARTFQHTGSQVGITTTEREENVAGVAAAAV